jgi:hypothetical protein
VATDRPARRRGDSRKGSGIGVLRDPRVDPERSGKPSRSTRPTHGDAGTQPGRHTLALRSVFTLSLAVLPIVVLLVFLVPLRWRAPEAAPVAMFTVAIVALVAFKTPWQTLAVAQGAGANLGKS